MTELRRALIAYNASGSYADDVLDWIDRYETSPLSDIVEGLDRAPEAFIGLLNGRNFGKLLIKLGDDPTMAGS